MLVQGASAKRVEQLVPACPKSSSPDAAGDRTHSRGSSSFLRAFHATLRAFHATLRALHATGWGAEAMHAGSGSVPHAGAHEQNRPPSPGTFSHGEAVSRCPLRRRGCVIGFEGCTWQSTWVSSPSWQSCVHLMSASFRSHCVVTAHRQDACVTSARQKHISLSSRNVHSRELQLSRGEHKLYASARERFGMTIAMSISAAPTIR